MPVVSIADRAGSAKRAAWSLIEIAHPGEAPVPFGVLVADDKNNLVSRFRDVRDLEHDFGQLEEQDADILALLPDDLRRKADEAGAARLLDSLEESLSHFLRISDRTAVSFTGDPGRFADRLFDRYVDSAVKPFVTHLPLYALRAAATKFGESMESETEAREWLRVAHMGLGRLRLTEDMFVAQVVGRSMEPLIPDGALCIFRAGVKGSRQGKRLLIEQFGENDFSNRYTVKRYTSRKAYDDTGEWSHEEIRLEPLNPEFPAFSLHPDEFRVIAEFVAVLPD